MRERQLLPQCFPKILLPENNSMKLDAKTVAGLELPGGKDDYIWFDGSLSGFGYRLRRRQRDGRVRATWVAQYRANGRTRRAMNTPVEKLKPAEAYEAARRILARVALGGDPQAEKATKRLEAARTLRSVIDAYLKARQPELRPSSLRIAKLYLTGPYFRPLHGIGVSEISHPEIAARISSIERAHGSVTAAAARRALSSLFGWAIVEGLMGRNLTNPIVGTRKPADPRPREHVLIDSELAAIWYACRDDDYGRIVRLLILFGCRPREIGGMRWSELQLDNGVWCLPPERSKNHPAHRIVLPLPALEILRRVPQSRDHLFGARGSGFTAWVHGKKALDQRLGSSVRPWQLRDVRRTVATRLGDLGVQPHVIEAVLNHQSGHRRGVAGVYNRSPYEREVTAALSMWAECMLALVEARGSKIVPPRTA
jgi:integrase